MTRHLPFIHIYHIYLWNHPLTSTGWPVWGRLKRREEVCRCYHAIHRMHPAYSVLVPMYICTTCALCVYVALFIIFFLLLSSSSPMFVDSNNSNGLFLLLLGRLVLSWIYLTTQNWFGIPFHGASAFSEVSCFSITPEGGWYCRYIYVSFRICAYLCVYMCCVYVFKKGRKMICGDEMGWDGMGPHGMSPSILGSPTIYLIFSTLNCRCPLLFFLLRPDVGTFRR